MNSNRFFLVAAAALVGAGILTAKMTPAKTAPPTLAPKPDDFKSTDKGTLAMQAMLQMSKEMQALGQLATAKVYADQATNPPPGTAARALEHIADEFDKQYESILAMRLRKIAAEIYQPVQAVTAPPATPAS